MGRPLAAKRAAVQTAAAVDAPIRISRNCPWNVTRCRCTVPETRLVLIYSQWVARYRAAFGSVGMLSVDLRVTMGLCTILDDLKVLHMYLLPRYLRGVERHMTSGVWRRMSVTIAMRPKATRRNSKRRYEC